MGCRRRAPLAIADVDGTTVAFLARHGTEPPPARLTPSTTGPTCGRCRDVGAQRVVASFACGSLDPELGPGLARRARPAHRPHPRARRHHPRHASTTGRSTSPSPTRTTPRCARLPLAAAGATLGEAVRDGGTVVVDQRARASPPGPSRAGTASIGADLINMTQLPGGRHRDGARPGLRRPSGLVTDFDAGVEDRPDIAAVTQEEVFATFAAPPPPPAGRGAGDRRRPG